MNHLTNLALKKKTLQYTLPRHPSQKPFSKPAPSSSSLSPGGGSGSGRGAPRNPGAERAVWVTVRALRSGAGGGAPLELRFAAAAGPGTSVLELKEHVARETGLAVDKVKLLFAKKPVGDSKILKEILPPPAAGGEETAKVEFSLMVLGGAVPTLLAKNKEEGGEKKGSEVGAVAQGLSGRAVLETDEFWGDLGGFLQQRIRDEGVAGEVAEVFKGAWKGR